MIGRVIDDLLDFTGDSGTVGKPIGSDLREGQAAINYPAFWHQLPEEWLPAGSLEPA